MNKHLGGQSIKFAEPVSIVSAASVVGSKEGEGPLSRYFDVILSDILAGKKSWEKAESEILRQSLELAVKKADTELDKIDYIITGDLLNQNTGSTYGAMDLQRPMFAVFGACSTIGEALSLGAVFVDGGFAHTVLAGASSHFCAAEKQFRFPLELGTQRPPSSTWTVTGAGSFVLSKDGEAPFITGVTTGKIVDMGVKDQNNMGAAMAPAAADVIAAHFRDFKRTPGYYDCIITGDLGTVGKELLIKLLDAEGFDISKNHTDCGIEIFNPEIQDTHAGGSGCACSAVTFAGYFYSKLKKREINRVLFVPTGALLSPVSFMQGENIPSIAHAVVAENKR
ncbi:MAG: stage V sporulation protein AD [Clostridiales bacterium]|jgi:stage V sporulation protein AD|nr:stage V sporulation protein AD [Clostridiales bacterium]